MAADNQIQVDIIGNDKLSPVLDNAAKNVKKTTESIKTDSEKAAKASTDSFDSVAKSASKMGDSLKGIEGTLKTALKGFLGFEAAKKAAQVLFDEFSRGYKMMIEDEQAAQRLSVAIGGNTDALTAQAEALKNKTLYDDGAIIAGQALLANYVHSATAIERLTPAILNFATAQGIELTTAMQIVGRAIADDGAELGRYKIKIEGAAGSNERAVSVFDQLTASFGGQAEAARQISGELPMLMKNYDDFLKNIAKTAAPVIDKMAKDLNDAVFGMNVEKEIPDAQKRIDAARAVMRDALRQGNDKAVADLQKIINDAKRQLAETDALKMRVGGMGLKQGKHEETAEEKRAREKAEQDAKEARQKAYDDQTKEAKRNADYADAKKKEADEKTAKEEKELYALRAKNSRDYFDEITRMGDEAAAENDKNREKQKKKELDLAKWRSDTAEWTRDNTIKAIGDVAQAAGANAEVMKGIRIGEAVIDGAAAIVSATRTAFTSSGSWQEALAASIVMDALIAAETAAQIATISGQQFATGGIVGGTSYTGDRVPVRVNSGEMVLNGTQQKNLFDMVSGGGGGTITVNISAPGADAGTVSALNRTSRTIARQVEKAVRNRVLSPSRLAA